MKAGVVGYIVTSDGRPVQGQFAETTLYTDWTAAVSAARAAGGEQLIPVVAAQPSNADGPRRGRPKKVEAE